jgi:tetratricopeptide (TPR) repeat protein
MQAIRLNPRLIGAVISRGSAHMSRGQYGLAIKDYEEALQLDRDNEVAAQGLQQARSEKDKQDATRKMSIESNTPN